MTTNPAISFPPEVSLTPLIDVVFLLLIFFMVSTSFDKQAQLEVTLPETIDQPPLEQPEALNIVIDAQGRFAVDGQALATVDRATLAKALERSLAGNSERPVVIQADAETAHRYVVMAMDVLGNMGVASVAIATEAVEDGG